MPGAGEMSGQQAEGDKKKIKEKRGESSPFTETHREVPRSGTSSSVLEGHQSPKEHSRH